MHRQTEMPSHVLTEFPVGRQPDDELIAEHEYKVPHARLRQRRGHPRGATVHLMRPT